MIQRVIVALLERALRADWETLRVRLDGICKQLEGSPGYAPSLLAQCLLVSGEDHRHARHPGFDWIAIGRVCWRRLSRGTREGGSTIEQQVVRVLTGRYERTVKRKLHEIALAVLVSHHYAKCDLPKAYLWVGYYGWRMNGYVNACRRLGLSPASLGAEEAARLVARLKYPQPRYASAQRIAQIDRRAKHLGGLYPRHLLVGTYRHLYAYPVHKRTASFEPVPQ